jgi:hypothetical protein
MASGDIVTVHGPIEIVAEPDWAQLANARAGTALESSHVLVHLRESSLDQPLCIALSLSLFRVFCGFRLCWLGETDGFCAQRCSLANWPETWPRKKD